MTGKCYDHTNKNTRVIEWISCQERLPEYNQDVLVCYTLKEDLVGMQISYLFDDDKDMAEYFIDTQCKGFAELQGVTHWAELPEGPK